jgi:hypothetical protein
MSDKTLDVKNTSTEVPSEEALEEALIAGFTDDNECNNASEAGHEAPSATSVDDGSPIADIEKLLEKDTTDEVIPKVTPEVTPDVTPEKDDWEGVPEFLKKKFQDMGTELERVTNIANSASGRANKLQSQVQREAAKPAEAPKPTSQQIHEAIASKDKRDVLRKEWPDLAAALDEVDTTISDAVGSQIDVLRGEMTKNQERSNANHEKYVNEQIKNTLDMRHPGWETTVSDKSFKDWVYKDGPAEVERSEYENALRYAQGLKNNSPSEAQALFAQANDMYKNMLTKYPTWATAKGNLYGDPSGTAAIKLLDMHKDVSHPQNQEINGVKDTYASQQAKNRERLERNISPTSGDSRQSSVEVPDDVEAAFEKGFSG